MRAGGVVGVVGGVVLEAWLHCYRFCAVRVGVVRRAIILGVGKVWNLKRDRNIVSSQTRCFWTSRRRILSVDQVQSSPIILRGVEDVDAIHELKNQGGDPSTLSFRIIRGTLNFDESGLALFSATGLSCGGIGLSS